MLASSPFRSTVRSWKSHDWIVGSGFSESIYWRLLCGGSPLEYSAARIRSSALLSSLMFAWVHFFSISVSCDKTSSSSVGASLSAVDSLGEAAGDSPGVAHGDSDGVALGVARGICRLAF